MARKPTARRIIVASLDRQDVREPPRGFWRQLPAVRFVGFWSDVLVRAELNSGDRSSAQRLRGAGSAAIARYDYVSDAIFIGGVVGRIFNNETGDIVSSREWSGEVCFHLGPAGARRVAVAEFVAAPRAGVSQGNS